MANYKYQNGKYYRQANDKSWFEVTRDENGNFTWVQPDGQKVYDPKGKVNTKTSLIGVPTYTGFGGTKHVDPKYWTIAQTEYSKNKIADPSENIFNDLIADTFMGIPKAIYTGGRALINGGINLGKNFIKSISEKGAKETAKQSLKTAIKATPTITGGIIGGTVVDVGSTLSTGKSWGQNVSDGLSHHWGFKIPTIVGDFTNPGYYVGGYSGKYIGDKYFTPYVDKVFSRYDLANISLAPQDAVTSYIDENMRYSPEVNPRYRSANPNTGKITSRNIIGNDEYLSANGGFVVKPGKTVETHINPNLNVVWLDGSPNYTIVSHNPVGHAPRKEFYQFMNQTPSGTVISSNDQAINLTQHIQNQNLLNRLKFYFTGKYSQMPTTTISGYSTDIVEQFNALAKKGKGIVQPSLTTRMKGTNIFGKNFDEFKEYFTEIQPNGEALFSNMTNEAVLKWNEVLAPKYGIYIDPITRTSEHLTLITK